MKKIFHFLLIFSVVLSAAMILSGCLKDTCTRTYTIYTPVYKTTAEVRTNIKSNAPQEITNPGKLFIRGKYIFLNEIDKGVHILDNTDPSSPRNVAFIDIPGNMDLAVKGNMLYADLYTDLVALDISDPLNVVTKKIVDDAFPFRRYTNGFAADTSKIIVNWTKKDTTVSQDCQGEMFTWGCPSCNVVFDRASFSSEAKASPFGMGGSMARFAIVQSNLYTVSESDLGVYSIAAATDPVFTGKINLGWGIETIYPFKDKLFIGSTNGMFIYSIANPGLPVRQGQFTHFTACDPVIADDNYAFVTLRNGTNCTRALNQLDIVNISNLYTPVLIKSYPLTNPHGLSKDGNTLFICDGRDGLKVFDARDVNNLKLLTHLSGFESYDVIAFNNLAILVSKDGLRQYDYSDLSNIKLLSKVGWEKK